MSPRPLRLLARPEPIDEVLALVPDGPPLRFRWRRALHEVVAAEGPERIAGAWWSEQGGTLTEWSRWPLAPLASATRADEPDSGECPARALTEWSRWPLAPLASATRADEPGSGECPARALTEWSRWPLAPLASATRADEPGSGECPARALTEWSRWPLAPLASATRDYFRIEDKAGLRFWLFAQASIAT